MKESDRVMPKEVIIKALNDPDWEIRRRAVMIIGRKKDQEGFPYLVKSLSDPDADVCRAAVLSISRLENPAAIPQLLDVSLLEHTVPEVRMATVQALGSFGDIKVLEAMLRALEDSEWSVRIIVEQIVIDFIEQIVRNADPEVSKRLIRVLSTRNKAVYRRAEKAFFELGELGFSLLRENLSLKNYRARVGISEALSYFPGERPVPHLITLLDDGHPAVRLSAVKALKDRRSPAALNPLVRCLSDFTPGVVKEAVKALAVYGDDCVKRLTHVLDRTPSARLKRNILAVLSVIGTPSCVISAVNLLNSSYYDVRHNAIETLESAGKAALEPVVDLLERQTWFSKSLLKRVKEEKNKRLQLRLIRSLGEMKDSRALSTLETFLTSEDEKTRDVTHQAIMKIHCTQLGRYSALVLLARLDDPRSFPVLKKILMGDESPELKVMAIKVIEVLRDKRARKPLLQILRSHEESNAVRAAAIDALRSMGVSSVVDDMIDLLQDSSNTVARKAVRALGSCTRADVVPRLVERMETAAGDLLKYIQLAISNFGDEAISELVSNLKTASPEQAFKLLDTFWMIAGDDIKEYIEKYDIPKDILRQLALRSASLG